VKRLFALLVIILLIGAALPSRHPAEAVTSAFFTINGVEDTGGCNGSPSSPAVPILNVSYGWQDATFARQFNEILAGNHPVYQWDGYGVLPEPTRTRTNVSGWVGGFVTEELPPGTLMTLTITLEFDLALTVSDTIQFLCDGTGSVIVGSGPDMIPLPSWAVVGSVNANVNAYWAPEEGATSDVVIEAGKTLWVLGIDETGQFYKVVLSGQYFWLPVWSMGPNYDEVWNGTPLPTEVVD
jgi:hypothetical protein